MKRKLAELEIISFDPFGQYEALRFFAMNAMRKFKLEKFPKNYVDYGLTFPAVELLDKKTEESKIYLASEIFELAKKAGIVNLEVRKLKTDYSFKEINDHVHQREYVIDVFALTDEGKLKYPKEILIDLAKENLTEKCRKDILKRQYLNKTEINNRGLILDRHFALTDLNNDITWQIKQAGL